MNDEHRNEPRNVGYGKVNKDCYTEWTKKDANSIFAGTTQADLFLFSMGIGSHRGKKSEPKGKANDISVDALKEDQKWALLSTGIAERKDLLILKDEKPIYLEAERYAEEGIKILNSHIEKQGLNYPKFLEAELRDLLAKE